MNKVGNIWDDMAKSFHALSSRSKAHKDKYLTIAKLIIDTNATKIIDFGCGSGLLENEIIKLGYKGDMCAVDSSEEMLRIAKSMCGERIEFIKMDLDDKISILTKYDVVVAINVLFFLSDKQKFLNTVHDLLADDKSIFIMVNPKPNKEASNWQFIKAHFSDTSFKEKILIALNEVFNLPKYYKMIKGQRRLSIMAKTGDIEFNSKNEIIKIAKNANLKVKFIEDIHAGQNWVFVMGRK